MFEIAVVVTVGGTTVARVEKVTSLPYAVPAEFVAKARR
jgi:hypothetical protein